MNSEKILSKPGSQEGDLDPEEDQFPDSNPQNEATRAVILG